MKYKNIIHMNGEEIEFDNLAPEEKEKIGERLAIAFMESLGYVPVRKGGGQVGKAK